MSPALLFQKETSRIDWKYVLGLELTDPGFDFSVLSEFRTRLVTGGAKQQLLDTSLKQLPLLSQTGHAHGFLKTGLNAMGVQWKSIAYLTTYTILTEHATHSQSVALWA